MDTSLLCRAFQCWNAPTVVQSGKFAHLTARARWVDGRVIVTATEVRDATVVELPEVACQVTLDEEGWIVVIVPGPCEIPARAHVVVRICADVAVTPWLAEFKKRTEKLIDEIVGDLL